MFWRIFLESSVGLRYKHPKMTRKRVCHGDIKNLWDRTMARMKPSRDRIRECKDMRNGVPRFKMPKEFDVPGTEHLGISVPNKIIVPLKTTNVMSRKPPRYQRHPVGKGLRPSFIAGNIETWVNAAVESKMQWGELIGKLLLDGECAVMVVPSLADWQHSPDFMDSLTADEYDALDEETKERYMMVDENDDPMFEEDDDDFEHSRRKPRNRMSIKEKNPVFRPDNARYVRVDDDGNPMPQRRYWRDSHRSPEYPYGRDPDDAYYADNPRRKFKEDRRNTERAFIEEQQHWLVEKLPFRISVVSAENCLPVFSVDQKLKGLIVKRTFNRETLLAADYIWESDSDFLSPTAEGEGEVTLYEYWGEDADGTPYVAYSVEGVNTYFKTSVQDIDGREPAVIDLRKEFGLRQLPVMYCWGLHFETDDVKMKGIPFLWPVLGAITGVEALSTSVLIHAYSTAFGAWGVQVDPQILRDYPELLTDNGLPRSFNFAPMSMNFLPGRPYPMSHPGVGKDVKDLLNMLTQASEAMAGAGPAFGGSGATSGHDRALSREYLETSMNQVLDGALQAYRFIGEKVLEICCGITKMTGVTVPVYATVPEPQTKGTKNKSNLEKAIIELRPEWVGPIYNLVAFYPKSAGENMAELQQLAQLYLQGLITFREFREKGFGDENPAATLIEIFTDGYLKSDAGKSEIAQLAAEMLGATSEEEKDRLMEEQRLTPGGTPLAALPPELQALNTGQIPPGVDPELFLTKLQGMMAHDAARASLKPSGPAGPGVNIQSLGAQAGANIPPQMGPNGAPGPAPAPGAGSTGNQAPTMTGLSQPNAAQSELGGIIAGQMGTASQMRDSAALANAGA